MWLEREYYVHLWFSKKKFKSEISNFKSFRVNFKIFNSCKLIKIFIISNSCKLIKIIITFPNNCEYLKVTKNYSKICYEDIIS